jgi:hypothetical protein
MKINGKQQSGSTKNRRRRQCGRKKIMEGRSPRADHKELIGQCSPDGGGHGLWRGGGGDSNEAGEGWMLCANQLQD